MLCSEFVCPWESLYLQVSGFSRTQREPSLAGMSMLHASLLGCSQPDLTVTLLGPQGRGTKAPVGTGEPRYPLLSSTWVQSSGLQHTGYSGVPWNESVGWGHGTQNPVPQLCILRGQLSLRNLHDSPGAGAIILKSWSKPLPQPRSQHLLGHPQQQSPA